MLWLDGARARELATGLVLRYCRNRNLQLLDGTVALARVGLRWTSSGLRIRRMFRFDFSLEGVGRRTGFILMLGTRLETVDDGAGERPTERTGQQGGPLQTPGPLNSRLLDDLQRRFAGGWWCRGIRCWRVGFVLSALFRKQHPLAVFARIDAKHGLWR